MCAALDFLPVTLLEKLATHNTLRRIPDARRPPYAMAMQQR